VEMRRFRKLRLSLTGSCNFTCVYCVHDGAPSLLQAQTHVQNFLDWVRAIHEVNPLNEIRLTGGEPTLYRDLLPLVKGVKDLGIPKIALTTNGFALGRLAALLRDAGLQSVNVSLDALDETVFRQMGGRNPVAVLDGIDAAIEAGLKVKINTTLVAEMNDSQILPLLGWAKAKNIPIRFLELMAMGHLYGERSARVVVAEEILAIIGSAFEINPLPRAAHATAHYYELTDGYQFGIIGNTSLPFCSDCDRLRLDSRGMVYGCLSNPKGFSLAGGADAAAVLNRAMELKQAEKFTGSALVMRDIGG
jgi:GTP 3',8-cyclase